MARFIRLVTLGSALVLFTLIERSAGGEVILTEPTDCVAEMNEPRKKAGFSSFTQATKSEDMLVDSIPKRDGNRDILRDICEGFALNPAKLSATFVEAGTGTLAISIQNGEKADCKAAVNEWAGGITKFSSLPPPYAKDTAPYTTSGAISLIALLNPNPNPTVDCLYFVCPPLTATELYAATEAVSGLACLTKPPALVDGKAPFTKEQWDKMKRVATDSDSGTTAAAPTFVVLMAGALGVSLI